MGGANRRHNVRLGEFLRAIYSHSFLAGVPRHTVRAAVRRCGHAWKTVGYAFPEKALGPWMVEPMTRSQSWDWFVHMNNQPQNEPLLIRRLYVCDYPDIWQVRAILRNIKGRARCHKCKVFVSVADVGIPDFGGRNPVTCSRCHARASVRQRRVERLAASVFHKDKALAESHLLLRELKQEIKRRA